ncbi:anti-sigma factor family protein [Aureliella helgolandensis]|uniref:Uncharacterized protein n=1 Tax=Aureliella helgolandensis TaxID=2527968 RepID=A0A518GC52_9BACT|nr:hypothetical protein [Aureliella helgolandensis]QDV26153.1 hypothetical protein Q31a_45250 [Aureliella helgolandensis]
MQINEEELIAYLLGNASPALRREIESQLPQDEELQQQLDRLKAVLDELDSLKIVYEPPAGLFDSTMARVDEAAANPTDRDGALVVDGNGAAESPDRPLSRSNERVVRRFGQPSLTSKSRFSFWDSTALCLSLTALCCLLLPAVVRARFEARRAQCADNMRRTGEGLLHYTMLDPAGRFPAIACEGIESFSGVYYLLMSEVGMPIPPSQLRCSSLLGMDLPNRQSQCDLPCVSTRRDLYELPPALLKEYQVTAGGDYAYSLGVYEDDQVVAVKSVGGGDLAIMGDTPSIDAGQVSYQAHGGQGVNILYGDGRVCYVSVNAFSNLAGMTGALDHPYYNRNQTHQAGVNSHDASLAPSHIGPLGPLK